MDQQHWLSCYLTKMNPFQGSAFGRITGIVIVVAVFLCVQPLSAQTVEEPANPTEPAADLATPVIAEEPAADTIEDASPEAVATETIIDTSTPSQEVIQDETVTTEELGASDASILPDSPWYGLKRFGRSIREAVTFDPIKKSTLQLRHANQELADVNKLIQEKSFASIDPAVLDKALSYVEQKGEAIKLRSADIQRSDPQSQDGTAPSESGELVQALLYRQIKQQKLLEHLEKQAIQESSDTAPALVERIQQTRERSAEQVGESVSQMEQNPERLAAHMQEVLEDQPGSEFKHLRNLEILRRVEESVPEEARDVIRDVVETKMLKEFTDNLGQFPPEERREKFQNYVEHIGGDETRHVEIFDQLKQLDDISGENAQVFEASKDIFVRRFGERVEQFGELGEEFAARARERALARFKEGGADVSKLRAIEDIESRINIDDEALRRDIEKHRTAAIQAFKEEFADPESQTVAAKFEKLSKELADNPDPIAFKAIQSLKENLLPAQREFADRMERSMQEKFIQRAVKEQEKFFAQITTSNPEDIQFFQELKDKFIANPGEFAGPPGTPGFAPFTSAVFEKGIAAQTDVIANRLDAIDDQQGLEQFQQKFQNLDENALNALRRRHNAFEETFKEKQTNIQNDDLRREAEASQLQFDPFCDDACQKQERQRFEQMIQTQKERPQPMEIQRQFNPDQLQPQLKQEFIPPKENPVPFNEPAFKQEFNTPNQEEQNKPEFMPGQMPELKQEFPGEFQKIMMKEEPRPDVKPEFQPEFNKPDMQGGFLEQPPSFSPPEGNGPEDAPPPGGGPTNGPQSGPQ